MIEQHVEKFKPNIILTHNQFETNIDHQIAYKAVEVASRPIEKNSVKKIYTFEVLCSGNWTFNKKWELVLISSCFFNPKFSPVK